MISSHPSSGFISARRKHHEQLKEQVQHDIMQTKEEKDKFQEEKTRAADEEANLRRSIEANRAALGKVTEVRSSAEHSIPSNTDRN